MLGAESLVRSLLASGIDTCFANPGTSEMHFVAALDQFPQMRAVPCLSETVVTGAADGYARMAERPSATLLHCGPGLANGLANLHNAMRARSPVVNLVGDQATYHAPLDPPLNSDIESLSKPVAKWVRRSLQAADVGQDAARAVAEAATQPCGVAVLALPSDTCWNPGGVVAPRLNLPAAALADEAAVEKAAELLMGPGQSVLMLGDAALRARPLALAAAITAKTGARLFGPTHIARVERGAGRHGVTRLPYPVDEAVAALAGTTQLVLAGALRPVAFFAYPGKPGVPEPAGCTLHSLATPAEDAVEALERLAKLLDVTAAPAPRLAPPALPLLAGTAITSGSVAAVLQALLPENAVVVDESVTFGREFYTGTADAAPHDWLQLTGGAIGCGLPLATGAAVAAPGRRVVTLQADGSALYSLQALWTQAREGLDVTTVILSNRRYAILDGELKNVGAAEGPASARLFDLGRPDIDWPALAAGFGVPAARVDTLAAFAEAFSAANQRPGPFLIELVIP